MFRKAAKILAAAVGFMPIADSIKFQGRWTIEIIHKDGSVDKHEFPNAVTTTGKNNIFDSFFRNNAPPTNWYIGLIDGTGFTATAVTDTMSAHTGWAELVDYTEANRQAATFAAASGGQITNAASVAVFTMNATNTVKGLFLISNNTKGGTTGILWTTGLFTTALAVVNTDVVKLTYNLGA